jgi:hypothetical protein
MVKNITGGRGLVVSGSNYSYPYIPINSNNPIQGMLRLNNQDMQVFDGSSWLTVGASYASIDLDADTQSLLEWARKKRDEEMVIERLAETNPTIKDLVNQIKDKQEQLKIVQTLIQKEITS